MAQLPTILMVVTCYYSFLTLAHYFVVAAEIRYYLMALSTGAAATGLALYIAVRAGKISASASNMAFLPVGVLGLANVYGHVALTGDLLQMTNGVLALIIFGIITLCPRIFSALTTLSVLLYGWCLYYVAGPSAPHFGFMLVAALTLGILAFTQRYRTLANVERLLIIDKAKNARLEAMNRAVLDQMKETQNAADQARRANEAKGIFLANTSHELRTPLTGVLGMMNLLERTKLTAEQEEIVAAAQVSAKTLLTLINDILDLAKLDEGKLELNAQPFVPNELVRRIVGLLKPAADEKGLILHVAYAPEGDLRLSGDAVRIGQILLNLVGNAIKFTETGRVDVSVEVERGDSNLRRLQLTVEDTGVGFGKEQASRLFQRFEQVDASARRRQGGAGLGLAICRELTGLMDGVIEADSMLGVGSRFRFAVTLPVASSSHFEHDARELSTTKMQALGLKVLIAEDNRINQMLVQKLLAPYGWDIKLVDNGAEAVAVLETDQSFDLVLMDMRMPVMDGVAATKKIRSLEGDVCDIPIIALTANTMPEDVQEYHAAGMNGVVGKPILVEDLADVVLKLFPVKPDRPIKSDKAAKSEKA